MQKNKNKAGIFIDHAKSKNYKQTLATIIQTEKCPFCPDNFKYHKKPILKKYKGWLATENSWPYKGAQYHFIFISEKHKEDFTDLNTYDFQALIYLINWLIKKYKITGGGLTMRFGEQLLSGSTVQHLHFHLIVPKLNKKTNKVKPVYFGIG